MKSKLSATRFQDFPSWRKTSWKLRLVFLAFIITASNRSMAEGLAVGLTLSMNLVWSRIMSRILGFKVKSYFDLQSYPRSIQFFKKIKRCLTCVDACHSLKDLMYTYKSLKQPRIIFSSFLKLIANDHGRESPQCFIQIPSANVPQLSTKSDHYQKHPNHCFCGTISSPNKCSFWF